MSPPRVADGDVAEPGSLLGRTLELRVGGPAHGGSCVARYPDPDGRAIFVRHTLPGETVLAVVTADRGGAYCFADAVEVRSASPDRVEAPCPYAGPGRCGGCDWQHVSGAGQRELKATVVRDVFRRLAGLEVGVTVEELPGGLLGWRTRNLYAVAGDGTVGMRKHASHDLVALEHCLLGAAGVADVPHAPPGVTGVELACGSDGRVATLGHHPGHRQRRGRPPRGRRPPDRVVVLDGPRRLHHTVLGRDVEVAADGFWQVHPAAVDAFATALLDAVDPRPGERVLDLYAGAGALTAALADAVGPDGAVIGVESSSAAVADAERALADLPQARVRRGRVDAAMLSDLAVGPDVVVLDPPRSGAGREVMTAICALRPRAIGYVACDPAALARDVATAATSGWRLVSLRAFDAFPMTHHVECVAVLVPE